MMKPAYWLWTTLGITLLLLLGVAGFNAWIDPLWLFDHAHPYNSIQAGFNERQQKTNHLTFTKQQYSSLVLGSSRVTYIDQQEFSPGPTYNYAVNNMLPYEYADYIDYAVQCNGQDFEVIYIGLDFYTTNRNLTLPNRFEDPSFYIQAANKFGYRFWNLLSFDALEYSWQNLQSSQAGLPINFAYDRHNVKTLQPTTPEEKEQRIAANLDWYGREAYGGDYEYADITTILTTLKERYPNTEFVLFTTPIAEPLYQEMIKAGRQGDFQRWLRECAQVFGQIYDFTTPNSVTRDLEYFYDASHVYPAVGTWMAHRVSGVEDPSIPEDFGRVVKAAPLP